MRQKDPELMKRISKYIAYYYAGHDKMPSTAQIAKELSIGKTTAFYYLQAMDKAGMISYSDGVIQTSSLDKIAIEREPAALVGDIACGDPTAEEENIELIAALPTVIFGKGPFFMLHAKGDSMEDEGIEEGDLLVIKKSAEAATGDIVVALDENNQNTLKKYEGVDRQSQKAILAYCNKAVYGEKKIFVEQLICQGVLSHIIKAI